MGPRRDTRATIKVLIVDDSALVRQVLTQALELDPRIEIVGIARNGVQAIEAARDLQPDVITLDIEMPELTGLEALPHIRAVSDARVVIISSVDDSETMYQALSLGAVDFIPKPKGRFVTSIGELCDQLLKTVKTAHRVSPDTAGVDPDAIARAMMGAAERSTQLERGTTGPCKRAGNEAAPVIAVAIAASTGGPPAVETVFRGLSSSLGAPVLVVQHLPKGFSESFARRLARASSIEVVEAEAGMVLRNGCGYIAPHGVHMIVEQECASGPYIAFDHRTPPLHGVHPAADPLFDSVANVFGANAVGVVLTGMGSDGARGLRIIKEAGGATIVQDEETSVIWGMPGAAMREKASNRTLPIGAIAAEVRRSVRAREADDE